MGWEGTCGAQAGDGVRGPRWEAGPGPSRALGAPALLTLTSGLRLWMRQPRCVCHLLQPQPADTTAESERPATDSLTFRSPR